MLMVAISSSSSIVSFLHPFRPGESNFEDLKISLTMGEHGKMTTMEKEISKTKEIRERTTIQSSIAGNYSGNNNSNNQTTIINYGIEVPSHVPMTFGELVARTGWGVSPPEIDIDHLRDESNLPQGDTGNWMFEDVRYRKWQERESRLLWICGGPGTGKTMLAKRVAAEFLGGPDPHNRVKAIFHFLPPELSADQSSADEDYLSQLSLAKVASDLLYSILQQDGNLFDGCKAELGKQGDRFFTNPSSLWKVLRKAIQDCQTDPVCILIDGVDGLGGRSHEDLIRRILGLMEIRTVKIFLSSRDVPYISNSLPHNHPEFTMINLDTNSFIKADVETFIRRKVNAWGWDMELKERATKCLLAKSDGIFLWASLAVKSLSYFHMGLDFDEFLSELPVRLTDVYRTMLHKLCLQGGSWKVRDMIQSVALALRPLTFGELGHILACIEGKAREGKQPCHRVASREVRLRSEKEIRMHVQSSMGFLRATETTVSIVHHTAIEYLFDQNRKDNLPILSKSESDLTISWECFRYLHHVFGDPDRLPEGAVSGHCHGSRDSSLGRDTREMELEEAPWEVARRDLPEVVAKWPYLRYAAESWFIHARRSIEALGDNFQNDSTHNWLQYQFFETGDAIRKPWIKLCGDSRMEVLAGEQTPLQIAICLGLVPLVENVLRDFPEGVNSKRSLHLAARFISGAHKTLIAECEGYLLTDPDEDGNTPLHGATIFGHSSMVKDLVERFGGNRVYGNEVNKTNNFGNTPLHLAFQFDHPGIVGLLVGGGADLTIKNYAHLTASELGTNLERGESLDILKQSERKRAEAQKEVLKEPPYLRENFHNLPTTPPSNNTNIENNYSIQPPSHFATTIEELVAGTDWGASRPEIDLNHLFDEHNLPVADTGRWIFEEAGYQEWRESQESKVLWLRGGPGTGKTMLAKLVAAEFLKELDNPSSGVKLVFHFVSSELPTNMSSADGNELSQRLLSKVARDLLYSILQQDVSLFDGCQAELERQGDGFFTNPSSLWEVLRKAIRDCRADPVYILIDGVDGLKENLCKQLIGRILKLREIRTVKIFLSSRDLPQISDCLPYEPHEFTEINLDGNRAVEQDVETFIICQVNSWGWNALLGQKAMETLMAKSEGIFLWVSLAIKRISSLDSGPDFDEILRNPLLELEDIYRKMLRSLFSGKVSRELLSTIWCVAFALRPLTFGELGYILVCIEEGTRAENQRPPQRKPGDVQVKTEKEIRMYVQSSMGFLRATNTTVSILHNSATEYLFDENRKDRLPVLSKTVADLKIARECFRYLHYVFGNPELSLPSSEVSSSRGGSAETTSLLANLRNSLREAAPIDPHEAAAKWPYLRYAAESWFVHARRGFKISKIEYYDYPTDDWIWHEFFGARDTMRTPWIMLCGDPKMEILTGRQPVLHIAASLGLAPLVQFAIRCTRELGYMQLRRPGRSGPLRHSIPKSQCTPSLLMNADRNGNPLPNLDPKELRSQYWPQLPQNGVDEKNGSGDTPLHLAFLFDHIDIVKLLLEEDADPTIKNNDRLTASELGAKLGRAYTLKKTRRGTVVVPVERPDEEAVNKTSARFWKVWQRGSKKESG